MCGKGSLRETVQPVGVGINVICKVSFTPTGGVAVFPEDWCSGASISDRQSRKSAKVGMGGGRGLACLCRYMVGQLVHRVLLDGSVFSMKYRNNLLGFGARGDGNGDIGIVVAVGREVGHGG